MVVLDCKFNPIILFVHDACIWNILFLAYGILRAPVTLRSIHGSYDVYFLFREHARIFHNVALELVVYINLVLGNGHEYNVKIIA